VSLTGNLEDLPLLDIIQIVSFSKKTGYLTIRASQGEAAIIFRDGFVVSSFAWDSLPLDPRVTGLAPDRRAALIRNRIEMALERLIRLREGQFSFSLSAEPPAALGGREIALETLQVGINPQELLLDLARGIDEDRRDSSAALEASFAQPAEDLTEAAPEAHPPETTAPEPPAPAVAAAPVGAVSAPQAPPPAEPIPPTPPPPAEDIRTLLLVDDEEDVRRVLAERFTQGGYQVVEAEDPESAVKKGGRLGKAGIPYLLVTDLGMPTSGGSSFHGGFEVVKRLWKMNQQPPVLMMTDSLSSALQARAKQMGISSFVFKPGLSKLDPDQFLADLRAFAQKLLDDVVPRMSRSGPVAPSRPGRAPTPAPGAPLPATYEELSREFHALQRRLEELRRPSDATQIAALVMRVAREFFERGILFLVKNDEVRGLGGFGPAPKEDKLNLIVRDVVIPLSEPSVFLDTVTTHAAFAGPMPDGRWGQYLMGKIGRFRSGAVALIPLLTHREVIALLYGDNPETGREFGRIEPLEVFINQAGIALENAFLQRKLQALQQRS
jgi:CheY-like chemotaxis protein